VVASKVNFTNNVKEMEEFISTDRILKELDGKEDWDYTYAEPVPGENETMKDTATRDRLLAAREDIVKEFESATQKWLNESDSEMALLTKAERDRIAARLREDYWVLDPYIRARSLYDRTGVLLPGGKLQFYPATTTAKEQGPAEGNGTTVATANDDVD